MRNLNQKKSHFEKMLSRLIVLGAVSATGIMGSVEPVSADYVWKGNGTELVGDLTDSNYWEGTSGNVQINTGTVNVSRRNTVTLSRTTIFGDTAGNLTVNIDGTLKLTGNRPVSANVSGHTNVINIRGTLDASAGNFCYGEGWGGKTTMNIYGGASVNMSGLIGSAGQATIHVMDGATLKFHNAAVLGWQGNGSNSAYMGIINQTGGTVNAMNTGRQWTNISGVAFTSKDKSGTTMPSGQYLLSSGVLNTVRMSANDDYDEDNYTVKTLSYTNSDRQTVYTNVGLTDAQKTLSDTKNFIMTGGQANIVSISSNASDAAFLGTLSVPTLFTGGTLNVLNIDASRMANDTFEQYGGVLSPNGGTWANNALTVDTHGISSTTITGNYNQIGGAIAADIAAGTSYDKFAVTGTASLAGVINVIDTSQTESGSATYNILTADGGITAADTLRYNVGGLNVDSYTTTLSADGKTLSVTVNYGNNTTYTWTGGTDANNDFLTRGNWSAGSENINYAKHIFGNGTNNAVATIKSGYYAGSDTMNMARDTSTATLTIEKDAQYEVVNGLTMASASGSTATLNVNGNFLASALTVGAGTANINVGKTGTFTVSGVSDFNNGVFTSAGTLVFDNELRVGNASNNTGATLTIMDGSLTTKKVEIAKNGATGSMIVGVTDGSTTPSVVVNGDLCVAGPNAGAGKGTLTVNSGNLKVTNTMDLGYKSNSTGTFNLNGGNVTFSSMWRTSEVGGSTANINISGGSLFLNQHTTLGSYGKTNATISGGEITALGQFVVNFYEGDDIINQTGGVANIWGNSTAGWNIRTNPGFMTDYVYNNSLHAGLQFGNGLQSNDLRDWNGEMQWNISGGELNTYRVSTTVRHTREHNLLSISGDAEVNIISSDRVKYSGILAVPTKMTGGTLNVETIYAKAARYYSDNTLANAAYNYMANGVFLQEGGVLSPDGGSVDAGYHFIASATGIGSTTIFGNYTLDGTGSIKLDVGEFSNDFSALNDKIIVDAVGVDGSGVANIGGSGIMVNLASGLLTSVQNGETADGSQVLLMTASSFTGDDGNIAQYGWNNQLQGSDYYWTSQVADYGDGLRGLYAVLTSMSTSTSYWDESAKAWNGNVMDALEIYVGSSTVGNSSAAPSAVINASNRNLGRFYVAYDAGTSGKLTITNNATVESIQLNQVGVSGAGELLIDKGATFNAANLELGVNQGATGTLTVNGVANIETLEQGDGGAKLVVGNDGNLSVTNETTWRNADIQVNGGNATFAGVTNFVSGTMKFTGDSQTQFTYGGTDKVAFFGNGATATINVEDSAFLQITGTDAGGTRVLKFSSGVNGVANLNVSDNATLVLGKGTGRNTNSNIHFGDGGKLTLNVSDNATVFANRRLYFGEVANGSRTDTINLNGNGKLYVGVLLASGSGNVEMNISDNAYLNVNGTFCVGYGGDNGGNGTTSTINQTGGTADIFGLDGEKRWGYDCGVMFGGAGWKQSTGTYNLSGGMLNTARISATKNGGTAIHQPATAPLFVMSGGELNVVSVNGRTDSGAIEVPFLFTGGTLNAEKIVAYGNKRSATWATEQDKTFYQNGGTISPDGGSTKVENVEIDGLGTTTNRIFVAGNGAANTTIVGNYVIDLNNETSIPVISLDMFMDTDGMVTYDTITVQDGDMTIDSNSVLEIVLNGEGTFNGEFSDLIFVENGKIDGTFGGLSLVDMAASTEQFISGSDLASWLTYSGAGVSLNFSGITSVPEPATWMILILGSAGLFLIRKRKA
ncbi:MAG: PEP-CTERM sorting domain-containing protein [Planctomycetia bacterium]|nr:PEP-CTERM sorting domain-containing protein [Planctomycetia bacterium]